MVGGRLLLAALLTSAALVSGCSSLIHGKPVANPGAGPRTVVPESQTVRSLPDLIATRATERQPAGQRHPVPPDQTVTYSSKPNPVRRVARSTPTASAARHSSPTPRWRTANAPDGVNITARGSVQWVVGNLGDIPTVTIDYRTYDAEGWTIAASESGTRFTNKGTGHGMFVSVEKVDTF